jgi:hypothetical protein
MDAVPASDKCEKALKQLTAMILNVCSGKLTEACDVDVSAEGCASTTVGELVDEIDQLILNGECQTAANCANAVNEGYGVLADSGGGGAAVADPTPTIQRPGPATEGFDLKPFRFMNRRELSEENVLLIKLNSKGSKAKGFLVPVEFFDRNGIIFDGTLYYLVPFNFDPNNPSAAGPNPADLGIWKKGRTIEKQ